MSELDHNLEALVRAAALSPRPGTAKERFLAEVAAPRRRPWTALATSAIAAAVVLAAVLQPPDAAPPKPPVPAEAPPRDVGLSRTAGDGRLSLSLRLPAGASRRPMLRLDASATLPERTILLLDVHRDEEELAPDGALRPRRTAVGGKLVQVRNGRFDAEEPFARPGIYRFTLAARAEDHPPDLRPAVEALACRDWAFEAAAWDDGLIEGVEPALGELDVQAEALRTLLVDYAQATVTEARWGEKGPPRVARAQAVVKALGASRAGRLLPVATGRLLAAARNLANDAVYFKWDKGAFQGPVTYYDGRRMKTFRGDPWTYEALGSAVAEALGIAQREAGLWALRELDRGGRREPVLAAIKALSAWPHLAPLKDLLDETASAAEVEAALRARPAK